MNEVRTIGIRRARRVAVSLLLGGLVLGGTVATVAALNGRGAGEPVATPVVTPAPVVTPVPVVSPAPVATPAPNDGGGDAMPITVDLENATGADVYVDIVDLSGTLTGAVSGTPGDGMSVEPYTLRVENLDARTLRLTWVDFPIDNALALHIDESGLRFVLVQPEPAGSTDAIGFDRELILTFAEAVSADQIEAFLQDGLDTPGE